MTQPLPPATVGSAPLDALAVNNSIGAHLTEFLRVKSVIQLDHDWLAPTTLTAPPYNFTSDQETLIKSAVNTLNTALEAVDMTFIVRLIGLPPTV